MNTTTIHRVPRPQDVARLTTAEVRDAFLFPDIFIPGKLTFRFTDLDRLAVGGAVPTTQPLNLENQKETGRAFFLERRELGAINTGAPGIVTVDGKPFSVDTECCLYVGMGAKEIAFASRDAKNPAKFYILSCPAHTTFPTAVATKADANTIALGSLATSNQRVIRQYIHEKGIKSCQLVMGYTELAEGSVWNSFPPHTHNRRVEVYFYFNLGDRILVHLLGEPDATRHLFVHNEQAALSPSWSIHAGCGQGNYKFIWGMAGENQRFDDMDAVNPLDLR